MAGWAWETPETALQLSDLDLFSFINYVLCRPSTPGATYHPFSDDEDEDEEEDYDDEEEEDKEKDGAEDGQVEEEPLKSEDDVNDEEGQELFDTENVVVCQYL